MQSIWQSDTALPSFPPLQKDISTNVLIIGGGITGILTAYFLHQQNIPYLLLEQNRICSGTTGYTTAKITVQHRLIYGKLLQNSGLEAAQTYLSANQAACRKYAALCQDIACDYEIRDNYIYATDNPRKLEDEMKALAKIGAHAVFRENLPLPLKTAGAVCFPKQAQFHPLKFLSAIAKKLNICENSRVIELRENAVVTETGTVTADNIIVTTHFPFLNKHGSYFLKLYQNRSYVIALRNAQQLNGMFADENPVGLSFRNAGDYLLLGGSAHRTGKKSGGWSELRRFAAEKYPASKECFFWAAQDCMSLDDMPYIGNYSRRTANLFTASGFSKWGMTGSMLAAMLLCDRITGKWNEYDELFSPSRSMLKPQLFLNGLEAVSNLLTFSKKRCPHLGCALKWNAAERSWDCPCHGSRFSEDGIVLDNPANGNLNQ